MCLCGSKPPPSPCPLLCKNPTGSDQPKTVHPPISAVRRPNPAFGQLLAFGAKKHLYLSCNIWLTDSVKWEKSTIMRRKNTIQLTMLVAVLAGAFMVLGSSASMSKKSSSCKQTQDQCCKKKNGSGDSKMTWESPHQFFSTI